MRDVLLIVDVLDDFTHENGDRLLASFRTRQRRLVALLERSRAEGIPVVYANDNKGVWDGDARRLVDTALSGPGGELIRDVVPQAGERFVIKPRYSAFDHTPLELILGELQCERLVIAGMTTEGCVTQSAIDARELGLKVTVVDEACASAAERAERTALRYLVDVVGVQLDDAGSFGRESPVELRGITQTGKESSMSEIANPRELFLHELGDILFVERALVEEALPKLIDEVTDEELKSGLENHLEQTRRHVTNVEQVFELLGEEPRAEPCIGFQGLKKEHDTLTAKASSTLIDLVDLGAAARTENYEIAAYEGLRRMAKGLGEEKAVELLDENLAQEKEALREVEKIATRVSNESFATSGAAR